MGGSNLSSKKVRFICLMAVLTSSLSLRVMAFELLSEGAMDSVSAVSADSAEDIINIAGSPSAGITVDGYERLPFQTKIKVEVSDRDEVSDELDYELSKEVESWASDLRTRLGEEVEVGYVDELPQTPQTDVVNIDFEDFSEIAIDAETSASNNEEMRFEIGRITQTFQLLESTANSITYQFERVIDSTAIVNIAPSDDNNFAGSSYITDLRSSGVNTLSEIRDDDRPLF